MHLVLPLMVLSYLAQLAGTWIHHTTITVMTSHNNKCYDSIKKYVPSHIFTYFI